MMFILIALHPVIMFFIFAMLIHENIILNHAMMMCNYIDCIYY